MNNLRGESTSDLVSVVIPTLNMSRFLGEAVQSVYEQSYTHWEIILVDDGSVRGEYLEVQAIARQDPQRLRLYCHDGHRQRGASETRNLGVMQARGSLIAFLDADDIWLPDKLAVQVEVLARFPRAAMTFNRVRYFAHMGGKSEERDQPFGELRTGVYEPPVLTLMFLRDAAIYPCPSATLIHKDALLSVGGFDRRFHKVRTDLAAWTKLTASFPVYADDRVVARYRQHPASSVAQMNAAGDYLHYELAFYRWLLRYIESLAPAVRTAIEPFACERMYYYSVQHALRAGWRSRLAWRVAVAPRLAAYRAFWRHGRWLKAMLPGRAPKPEIMPGERAG
ncbi:MAG: glycosyltransferase [Chloroflexi bacterium]|nr:glycosyltransferase [Chloroflexota bacterium]